MALYFVFLFSGKLPNAPTINFKDNAFQVLIEPGDLYGPENGIYVVSGVESARTIAKKSCLAGRSYYEQTHRGSHWPHTAVV